MSWRVGILIKGGAALQMMCKVDVVVFDKTGTLTSGRPSVASYRRFTNEFTEDQLWALTAAAESVSEHPLATAIVEKAKAMLGGAAARLPAPSRTEVAVGRGISCDVRDPQTGRVVHVRVGSRFWFEGLGIAEPAGANEVVREMVRARPPACVRAVERARVCGVAYRAIPCRAVRSKSRRALRCLSARTSRSLR